MDTVALPTIGIIAKVIVTPVAARHRLQARAGAPVSRAIAKELGVEMFRNFAIVVVVFLSLLFLGCVTPIEPTDSGGLTIKQGTVGRVGNLSIGVVSVSSDSASISLWDGTIEKTFDLAVGEEIEFKGYTIRNLEMYVDPIPSIMPGSSGSHVTVLVSRNQTGQTIQNTITEKEVRCGAYYGFYAQKKLGTPDDWVWDDAGKSSNWHAPNKTIDLDCLSSTD